MTPIEWNYSPLTYYMQMQKFNPLKASNMCHFKGFMLSSILSLGILPTTQHLILYFLFIMVHSSITTCCCEVKYSKHIVTTGYHVTHSILCRSVTFQRRGLHYFFQHIAIKMMISWPHCFCGVFKIGYQLTTIGHVFILGVFELVTFKLYICSPPTELIQQDIMSLIQFFADQ